MKRISMDRSPHPFDLKNLRNVSSKGIMEKTYYRISRTGLTLPKKVGWMFILILMAGIALTNPSPERVQAALGDRIDVSLNLVVFTLTLVSRETCFKRAAYNEEMTHQFSDGWEFSEYHIGIFGSVF